MTAARNGVDERILAALEHRLIDAPGTATGKEDVKENETKQDNRIAAIHRRIEGAGKCAMK